MPRVGAKRQSGHGSTPTIPAAAAKLPENLRRRHPGDQIDQNRRNNGTSSSFSKGHTSTSHHLNNRGIDELLTSAAPVSSPVQRGAGRGWKGRIATLEPFLQANGFLYTFIILYAAFNVIVLFYGATPDWENAIKLKKPWYLRLAAGAARGGGALLNANSALIVLVAARRLITYLRTTFLNMVVPFDKAMPPFHTLVGHVLVFSTILHCAGHGVNYIANKLWTPGFHGFLSLFCTGAALVAVLLAIRITVIPRIRKARFELFYYTHVVCFILYYVFLIIHGSHHGVLSSWRFVVGPLAIYLADRISRLLRENVSRFDIAQSAAQIQSPNVVCLRVPRTFKYLAGQYCDIKVPQVSTVEWHPFTIASSPHESDMLFFIKVNGDWTQRLYNMFNNPSGFNNNICQVHIRGPFGAPAQHVGQYEHVVLISGGVGATPFASIAKYAHNWILNYTERGATVNASVSAAFIRNQSTHVASLTRLPRENASGPISLGPGSSSQLPGTPSLFASTSSRNIAPQSLFRNMSNHLSRNFSRIGSGADLSRKISQSTSQSLSRASSFIPSPLPADQQRRDHHSTGFMDSSAAQEHESRGIIFMNRPPSPSVSDGAATGTGSNADTLSHFAHSANPSNSSGVGLDLPVSFSAHNAADHGNSSRGNLGNFLTDTANTHSTTECDYPDDLGDPDAPVPDRRAGGLYSSASTCMSSAQPPSLQFSIASNAMLDPHTTSRDNRHMLEVVREYNSSESLFSETDDDESRGKGIQDDGDAMRIRLDSVGGFRGAVTMPGQENVHRNSSHSRREQGRGLHNAHDVDRFDSSGENEFDPDLADNINDSMDFDNMVMREVPLVSNAANLIGLSYGSTTMMRHIMGGENDRRMRASLKRASMTMMDEALDNASWQEQALFYLHTVTVNWFLLWTMLLRYGIAAIAGITDGFLLGQKGLAVFSTVPLVAIDLLLAVVLAVPIFTAVVLELYMNGLVAFLSDSYGNMFDIVLLVPLSGACVVLNILGLADVGTGTEHVSKITLLVFWPLISLLVLWRIGRTIGSRIMLAQYFRSTHSQTKSLDFIWVSKTHDEDEWLVREMLPLADTNIVRLHRYITREGPTVEPWTLDYERIPLKTHHVRPDWDKVFSGIAERSKSGTIIGVFHCGPSNMAVGVQQGAMKAMAKSLRKAYRLGYTQAMATESRNPSAQGMPDNIPEGARYGCAVRFSLREESFG